MKRKKYLLVFITFYFILIVFLFILINFCSEKNNVNNQQDKINYALLLEKKIKEKNFSLKELIEYVDIKLSSKDTFYIDQEDDKIRLLILFDTLYHMTIKTLTCSQDAFDFFLKYHVASNYVLSKISFYDFLEKEARGKLINYIENDSLKEANLFIRHLENLKVPFCKRLKLFLEIENVSDDTLAYLKKLKENYKLFCGFPFYLYHYSINVYKIFKKLKGQNQNELKDFLIVLINQFLQDTKNTHQYNLKRRNLLLILYKFKKSPIYLKEIEFLERVESISRYNTPFLEEDFDY